MTHDDAPIPDARPAPVLAYAGPADDQQPLNSPIVREDLPDGGLRLTDPPRGWWRVPGEVLSLAFIVLFAPFAIGGVIDKYHRGGGGPEFWGGLAALTIGASLAAGWAATVVARARRPLIIEVAAGELRVTFPRAFTQTHRWFATFVMNVRASTAWPVASIPPRMASTLLVELPGGTPLRLLTNRPVAEVRWVARELLTALARHGWTPLHLPKGRRP